MNVPPILAQSVRYGENYVSRALNEKFSGIFPSGIYRGFILKPSPYPMTVTVGNADDWPTSVAVVERNGYSVTVIMRDAGDVSIPALGEWFICLECLYSTTQLGYQHIVVRAQEDIETHHIVLGKVTVGADDIITEPLKEEQISDTGRMVCNPVGYLNSEDRADLDRTILLQAEILAQMLRAINRLANVELALAEGLCGNCGNGKGNNGSIAPAGYETPSGARVAPLTIVGEGASPFPSAAFTLFVNPYDKNNEGA